MAQLQEIDVRMRQLTEELEEKSRDYETLQNAHQSMFHTGEVPSHSPLWYATISVFANADDIQLMTLSPCQGCNRRRRSWKNLFKVTVLLSLSCEHALAHSEV